MDTSAYPLSLRVVDESTVETTNESIVRGGRHPESTQFPFTKVLGADTNQVKLLYRPCFSVAFPGSLVNLSRVFSVAGL